MKVGWKKERSKWSPPLLLLAALVAVWTCATVHAESRVRLVNNGYEDVVIGLSTNVREQDGPALVEALTRVVIKTSQGLFTATHRRAYLRTVTILIPRSWSSVKLNDRAGSESFENSDIRVDTMNPVYKHQPYTEQTGGCGDPGEYIHLTPTYLLNDTTAGWYGPRDKALLLEWAKLRWGVFDEIGYPNDPIYPPSYEGPNGYTPTLCANAPVPGRHLSRRQHRAKRSFGPAEQCCFVPNPQDRQTATSSLLSYPSIMSEKIIHFCGGEGREHNTEAPTKQNDFCKRRSTWDVISDHADFRNGANPPVDISLPDVAVRVVQQADASYALVLDYSSSMNDYQRVTKLRNTARRWLLHEVATGSSVAIINFNAKARLVRGLTKIENDASRRTLANAIETTGGGYTSIGAGLRMATKTVLVNTRNPVILLITDGEENRNPQIDDVMDEVVASGVRVVTVAFGKAADQKLETVAEKTGGKTFTVQDVDAGQMLQDAFLGALTYQPPPPAAAQTVTIYEKEHRISGSEEASTFNVDFTSGKKLTLALEPGTNAQVTSLLLTGPDGTQHTGTFDSTTSSWTVIVDHAEEGEWRWKAGVSGQSGSPVSARVTSLPRNPSVHPIKTRAWVNQGAKGVTAGDTVIIRAEVKQGNNPVIYADVRAIVTPPNENHKPQIYQLLDNGQGADTTANDGIYSRYMTKFSTTGRYSVKAQVTDGGTALINHGFHTTPKRRRRQAEENTKDKEEDYEDEPVDEDHDNIFLDRPPICCGSVVPVPEDAPTTGSFERVASGGSLKVDSVTQEDKLPPARVRDLQVQLVDGEEEVFGSSPTNAFVTLSWTATGDDWDSGIVSGYELRMTTNMSDLLDQNFIISENSSSSSWHLVDLSGLPDDVEGGTPLSLNVSLSLTSATIYYFALRAWDDVPLVSEVSNIATLYIPAAAPEPATLPVWAWAVIGVAALCVVALVLAGLMVCVTRKKSPENSRLLEGRQQ